MPIVRIYKGDLFEAPTQTLVNTVNCVGAMGAGIALEFKNRYPAMYQVYRAHCRAGAMGIGKLMLWTKERPPHPWVLNFPTKDDWKDPSRLEYIEAGLEKFLSTYSARGITSITFPQLGCANGKLSWRDVLPIMESYLNQVDIPVEIVIRR